MSVATLWVSPGSPRPVDAVAVAYPTDPRRWVRSMTTDQQRGLVGRVETQSLYGEELVVTAVRGSWLHVVALGQPSSRDRRGYPGWVPARQVTTIAPVARRLVATVLPLTTWLLDPTGHRVVEASVGTRLPVLSRSSTMVQLAGPGGAVFVVPASVVAVGGAGTAARPLTPSGVVATARAFLGVPYLWGGRSGFAVDCSGFTQLVYLLHGIVLPRDTGDQAHAGRAVPFSALAAGDLVLFGPAASPTHVGLVVGPGRMLHAPRTGSVVSEADTGRPVLARRLV